MNFVLVDAPNFVLLVASAARATSHPLGRPQYLNPVFSDLVRLLDMNHHAGDCSSQLIFEGASIPAMRGLLKRYGFDLPPLDAGELYGLLEYCDRLDAFTGKGMFTPNQLSHWQSLSDGLDWTGVSPGRRAISMFSLGDLHGLRGLHRQNGTLAHLGRAYRDLAESLSHLANPL